MALCRELRPIVAGQSRVTRGSPVIGFVKTLDKPSVRPSAPLEEKALHWLASISDRKLSSVEDLLCENATYHVSADVFTIDRGRGKRQPRDSNCIFPGPASHNFLRSLFTATRDCERAVTGA
jgi:hypothetical protein